MYPVFFSLFGVSNKPRIVHRCVLVSNLAALQSRLTGAGASCFVAAAGCCYTPDLMTFMKISEMKAGQDCFCYMMAGRHVLLSSFGTRTSLIVCELVHYTLSDTLSLSWFAACLQVFARLSVRVPCMRSSSRWVRGWSGLCTQVQSMPAARTCT